jgi:hypothetical protein
MGRVRNDNEKLPRSEDERGAPERAMAKAHRLRACATQSGVEPAHSRKAGRSPPSRKGVSRCARRAQQAAPLRKGKCTQAESLCHAERRRAAALQKGRSLIAIPQRRRAGFGMTMKSSHAQKTTVGHRKGHGKGTQAESLCHAAASSRRTPESKSRSLTAIPQRRRVGSG